MRGGVTNSQIGEKGTKALNWEEGQNLSQERREGRERERKKEILLGGGCLRPRESIVIAYWRAGPLLSCKEEEGG